LRGNRLSDVKKANKRLLYECIRDEELVTITELEHMTKLSRPTIVELVHEMEKEGKIVKAGLGTSRGGRSPMLYRINECAAFAMGIDVEIPAIRMAISDLRGRPICTSIRQCPPDSDANQVLSHLLYQAEDLLKESGINKEKLLGIGVGIPGIIDRRNNYAVVLERIKGWENIPIGEIIEDHIGRPVQICNDVDLLARAERSLFPENALPNMLYIMIRSGIGMSIWMDGKLLQGEWGNAGRVGHMLVNTEGPACLCGSRGCLALYIGEKSMRRMYRESSGKEVGSIKDLLTLANSGDSAAIKVMETAGHYLGIGIVNVANLFDIAHIVVSGPFELSRLLKEVEPAIKAREQHMHRKIHVVEGKLDESQYALGGCMMVLEHANTTFHGGLDGIG